VITCANPIIPSYDCLTNALLHAGRTSTEYWFTASQLAAILGYCCCNIMIYERLARGHPHLRLSVATISNEKTFSLQHPSPDQYCQLYGNFLPDNMHHE
jgi:hypothetical protein